MGNDLVNPKANGQRRHSRLSYVIGYGLAFLILVLSIDKFQRRIWPHFSWLFSKPAPTHVNQLPADVREILEGAETMELILFAGAETLDVNNFDHVAVQKRVMLKPADRERIRLSIDLGIADHFGVEPTSHIIPTFGIRAVANGKSAGLIYGGNGMLLIYRNDNCVDVIRTSAEEFAKLAETLKAQE